MSSDPPVPQSASYSRGADLLTVIFDKPLAPGPISAANWTGVRTDSGGIAVTNFVGSSAFAAAGDTVTGTCVTTVPGSGQSRVSYDASPPDLVGADGAPVAAFADFPLSTVP